MSRFVSSDDADFHSLEEQLIQSASVHADNDASAPGSGAPGTPVRECMAPPAAGGSARADTATGRRAEQRAGQRVPASPQRGSAVRMHGGSPPPPALPRARAGGLLHPPAGGAARKLGTWDGVFMPVTLNVLGIILFLRFGFILGQAGLLGSFVLLAVSYGIDAVTVLSVNAISTNGQVRGGGAYYLISRSLGPEFGGSIGLVFFLGQALNATMNVLGFIESLMSAFGVQRGTSAVLPEGAWYLYTYGTIALCGSTLVCLFGSAIFARATLVLAILLSVAVTSIPVSTLLVPPFEDAARDVYYSSWSWTTFTENLWPHFTTGAAGSSMAPARETWQSVFGVLFPAVCGILAGASMSGDLRKPSKSIPKGTNWALVFTFGVYVSTFVIMAATIPRQSLYRSISIVGDVSQWPAVVLLGEMASCMFSALMGIMASAKVLQAIARDDLLPLLAPFAQGTTGGDVPVYALLLTWAFCQLVLLLDSINMIAQLVTMTTLLTFAVLSVATFALKAGGAPSFRPSFRYFNMWTAGAGALISVAAMLFTETAVASTCIVVAVLLFVVIQLFSSPKPWGDVTHNVTYHFVRKYLLRLDERKGHVKYWRPQILLLANNPRNEWNLIIFCNSLKKGALYILGHVITGDFYACLPELREQHLAWLKLVDVSGVKGFVDLVIAPDEREGARNLILSSGLGGMRPNIIVVGFPVELQRPSAAHRGPVGTHAQVALDVRSLPTDASRAETPIKCQTYVGILEDALALNKALAVAYGFDALSLPGPSRMAKYAHSATPQYIDLWPIQIANHAHAFGPTWDTYTMVLQLGTILSLTGTWKHHTLRVSVFVEHADEVEPERQRVRALLENLRIPALLRVFCLSLGGITRYDALALGKRTLDADVNAAVKDDPWWVQVCKMRQASGQPGAPRAHPIDAHGTRQAPARPRSVGRSAHASGVCVPEAHLAFHYNNIRLGLSHPRSHVDECSDQSADDDSLHDADELESQLASLAVDWDPVYARGGGGRASERTPHAPPRSSARGSASHEPPGSSARHALLSESDGAASSSYGTLSSSQRTVTPATVATKPGAEVRSKPVAPVESAALSEPAAQHSGVPSASAAPLRPWPMKRRGSRGFALSFNELPNKAQYLILK
ncbi:hypothetical protein MSPP1_000067 [Malassezia sp. CBS 17886]|nr:hypothetical protein MSPP1_000067 [Malassezia sp. CBS 17886]